jgi:hypothetical protein
VAKDDLAISKILLQSNFYAHSMFYLSQSFEKANKCLLALIKQEYLTESESTIEEYLSKRIGHDKKQATKEIIHFLQERNNNMEFEQIKGKLSKSIKSFKLIESIKDFHSTINEDLSLYNNLRTTANAQSDFLHQKYYENDEYKYQIICYILRRYFTDIENIIRYPTDLNDYSINNPFNDTDNESSIKKLFKIIDGFFDIITSLSARLLKTRSMVHS